MSYTRPEEAHHVKKGAYIMLKGFPCKIAEVKTSKTGKHGHAKCNITGIDVLSGKKYNEVHPGHIVLNAFDCKKDEYDMMDIDETNGNVECLDENGGQVTFPLDTSNEVIQKLMEDRAADGEKQWSVTVLTAPVGEGDNQKLEQQIVEYKELKD